MEDQAQGFLPGHLVGFLTPRQVKRPLPDTEGMNLVKLVDDFHSEGACRKFLEGLRWPDGVRCPRCNGATISRIVERDQFDCDSCRYQFSVTAGTIFNDTHLPLWKWFMAVYLIGESKKGISANQLKRTLGVNYRTAWYLSHRIRAAMISDLEPLLGTVEVDSTWIGGKPRHPAAVDAYGHRKRGPRPGRKASVAGAVARGGAIRLRVQREGMTMRDFIGKAIADKAPAIYTDEWAGYQKLGDADTKHESVNHHAYEWVRGDVHTNTIESAWSLLKRSIIGSYHHLSVKHFDSYLDEFEWRYNNRRNDFLFRETMLALLRAEKMPYKELIERPA